MEWEYEIFNYYLNEEQLNELGRDKWELVAHNVSYSQWRETVHHYTFKRPKQ